MSIRPTSTDYDDTKLAAPAEGDQTSTVPLRAPDALASQTAAFSGAAGDASAPPAASGMECMRSTAWQTPSTHLGPGPIPL